MATVLVVDDSPVPGTYLENILVHAGYDVVWVLSGTEALAAVQKQVPDVVLTEMQTLDLNGLELVRRLRAENPTLPVILTTSVGNEELAVEALRVGAASYIPKRNLARDLAEILAEILSVTQVRKRHELFMGRMISAEHQFELGCDPDLIPQAVGHVETLMRQLKLFDESAQMRVGIALHEAIVNAMIHGNLEVGSDLKGHDWKAYHHQIANRSEDPRYNRRRVTVTVRARRQEFLEVRIEDEGPGFDPQKLPDPTDPENIGKESGRGLLLIRTFFDRVTHNETGNVITMWKGQTTDGGA